MSDIDSHDQNIQANQVLNLKVETYKLICNTYIAFVTILLLGCK